VRRLDAAFSPRSIRDSSFAERSSCGTVLPGLLVGMELGRKRRRLEATFSPGAKRDPSFAERSYCGTALLGLHVGMELGRKRRRRAAALQGGLRPHAEEVPLRQDEEEPSVLALDSGRWVARGRSLERKPNFGPLVGRRCAADSLRQLLPPLGKCLFRGDLGSRPVSNPAHGKKYPGGSQGDSEEEGPNWMTNRGSSRGWRRDCAVQSLWLFMLNNLPIINRR